MGLRVLIKALRHPWLIKLFRRSTFIKYVREQKDYVSLPQDRQLELLLEEFKVAMRETDFVREFYPELLSVEDPEDLLKIRITPEYPDEGVFRRYKKYILRSAYTSGTTMGKPKKVFYPLTKKSVEILVKAAAATVSIALLNMEKNSLNRILAIVEPSLAVHRFIFIAKFASKKVDVIVRGKVDVERFLRKTKAKYDMVFGELPYGITLLNAFRKYGDRLDDNTVFVTGGGIFTKDYLDLLNEVMDRTGKNITIVNMYGSTEGLFGGFGVYLDKDHPYYTEPPYIKAVYTSSFHIGAELTEDSFKPPIYPKDFIHRMPPGTEYSVAVTLAFAFAVPNYSLGDIAINMDQNINIIGRNIRKVSGLPIAVEAYTSPVIRVSGIVIKQSLSELVKQVIGHDEFIVVVSPKRHGAVMEIITERENVSSDLNKKLLELVKRSPEHSYLLKDVKDGVLTITFKRASGISSFFRSTRERSKIFFTRG